MTSPAPRANRAPRLDARHGIATQAWSPLGHGQLISDPTVNAIAERHGKTAAQILLRWNLELGNIVISKSVTPERIRSNMEIFDFELALDDHDLLATLDTGNPNRSGPDRLRRSEQRYWRPRPASGTGARVRDEITCGAGL